MRKTENNDLAQYWKFTICLTFFGSCSVWFMGSASCLLSFGGGREGDSDLYRIRFLEPRRGVDSWAGAYGITQGFSLLLIHRRDMPLLACHFPLFSPTLSSFFFSSPSHRTGSGWLIFDNVCTLWAGINDWLDVIWKKISWWFDCCLLTDLTFWLL
jgi:hypothetical protein